MIFYGTREGSTIHHRTDCSKSSVTEDDAYQRTGDDMPSMVMKASEVICIASGIYEGYDRTGPFIVAQDFDLEAFIDKAKATVEELWEISGLMYEIPRMLLAQGLITKMPCRSIYLGAIGDFELGEEKEDF